MIARFFALFFMLLSSFAYVAESSQTGALFGLCSPMVDMIVTVKLNVITDAGLDPNGFSLASTPELEKLVEAVPTFPGVQYEAGGSTLNSLRIAQLQLDPGATVMVGPVGDGDEHLNRLIKQTSKDGVSLLFDKIPGTKTGTCAVMIPEDNKSHRSLLTSPAAAYAFREKFLEDEQVKDAVQQAQVFFTSGYFILTEDGFNAALNLAKYAKRKDKIFCLNLAAPFVISTRFDQLMELIKYTDFIFGNKDEAAAFAEKMNWKAEDAAQNISKLESKKPRKHRVTIITQGADPTILATSSEIYKIPVKKIDPKDIVDVNGAGDAFTGGFLAEFIKTKEVFNLKDGVEAGHKAARMILQNIGCSFTNPGI